MTSSSQPTTLASSASASTTKCQHSPRSLLTLKLPYGHPYPHHCACRLTHDPGRERSSRTTSFETGLHSRTDLRPRRIYHQNLLPIIHNQSKPEILPHQREQKLLYRAQHREAHFQLQHIGGLGHDYNGGTTSVHRPILFPGRKKGLRVNDFVTRWIGT